MEIVIIVLALALLAVVVGIISAPLRAATKRGATDRDRSQISDPSPELSELEAAREAKYREIRDAELDFRTGKLSREDDEAIDGALRAEALEILNRIARAGGEGPGVEDSAAGGG
jgi:flagellar biosynthesis/type III secretory pathway M-ring protein FliF/YscJ